MKNKIKVTTLIAVLVFMSATVSNAQFRRTNPRMVNQNQCYDIPGLNDAQKEKIAEINSAHQKTIDDMRDQFWAAEDITSANEIKAKMTLEQNNHLKKISEVLDEEQLKFFNENVMAGPAGGKGNGYMRGGRGMGNRYAVGSRGGRGFGPVNRPGRGRNAVGRGCYGGGRGYRR